jgi:WD40 repeat protein
MQHQLIRSSPLNSTQKPTTQTTQTTQTTTYQIWSLSQSQARAVLTLDAGANVCSISHHPSNCHQIAVGSASHHALIYDLRSPRSPLATLRGHSKAVSYVKWLSDAELVTSSIDSTVRLWQHGAAVAGGDSCSGGGSAAALGGPEAGAAGSGVELGSEGAGGAEEGGGTGRGPAGEQAGGDAESSNWSCVRTFTGHTNLRNFVGLSVCSPFIACGSETNDVCVYYKGVTHPVLQVPLVPPGVPPGVTPSHPSPFVSAVCWRGGAAGCGGAGASTLLAANSLGGIWLLSLS